MIFSERVLDLGLPLDQIIVYGSGILDELGLREARDIDLIASDTLFTSLGSDSSYGEMTDKRGTWLQAEDVEIWPSWHELTFDQLMSTAVRYNGIAFVAPEIVVRKKRQRDEPKDVADIALLEGYYDRTL